MTFFIFIYPVLEIYLWYLFINKYGFFQALSLAIMTGVLGLLIVAFQGRATIFSIQTSLMQGKVPVDGLLRRGLSVAGGIFLILPGILSKIFGLLLILPGTYHFFAWQTKIYLVKKINQKTFQVFVRKGSYPGRSEEKFSAFEVPQKDFSQPDIIDVKPLKVEHQEKRTPNDDR